MTWVKLCGMTRRADVEAAQRLGADAVGFVVYQGSPRRVDADQAASLGAGITIERFLVMVDQPPDAVVAAADRAGVTGVQLHGQHASSAARAALAAGLTVLFAVSVGSDPVDVSGVPAGATPILDTRSTRRGGSGRRFDWRLAEGIARPWVLAGGLTAGTVGPALRLAAPWGVDVASGIEVEPGVKDVELMRAFIGAVR